MGCLICVGVVVGVVVVGGGVVGGGGGGTVVGDIVVGTGWAEKCLRFSTLYLKERVCFATRQSILFANHLSITTPPQPSVNIFKPFVLLYASLCLFVCLLIVGLLVDCWLFVGCCLLFVVCCLLFVVCCLLFVAPLRFSICFIDVFDNSPMTVTKQTIQTKKKPTTTTKTTLTQYNTIQYNTIQYNTIQYNTIQYTNYPIRSL